MHDPLWNQIKWDCKSTLDCDWVWLRLTFKYFKLLQKTFTLALVIIWDESHGLISNLSVTTVTFKVLNVLFKLLSFSTCCSFNLKLKEPELLHSKFDCIQVLFLKLCVWSFPLAPVLILSQKQDPLLLRIKWAVRTETPDTVFEFDSFAGSSLKVAQCFVTRR